MTEILRPSIDVTAVRDRFSSLRDFAFLDAPGGSQVPDEVGEAIARALREASANLGAGYATSRRVGEILAEAERKAARFLGCEPHEVIFGPNMTSLNFTLSRTAGRGFQPGDEILVSSLDHDGGVAPWLELAHDKDLVVRHVELQRRHDARLRRPAAQARAAHQGGRVRVGVQRGRHGRGCPARLPAGARRRRARLDRRGPLRGARADRRPRGRRRRADLLAVQVLRPAPGHGLRPGRGDRELAALQGPPGALAPLGPPVRDRHACPTSCWPGSTRRSTTWTPSAASRRSCPTSARWASGSLTASPTRSPCTGCRGWTAGCRRSWSTSTAWRRRTWPRSLADAQIGVWAHDSWYSLDLYQRLGYPDKSVRIGFIHYNTADEVDRLVAALEDARRA